MKYAATHWIGAPLAALGLLSGASTAQAEEDVATFTNSSVRIFCAKQQGMGTGSGFLVGNDGKHVLTNSHVITGCQQIVVISPRDSGEPKKSVGTVIWNSKTSLSKRHIDAALVELADSVDRPGVKFATKRTMALRDPVTAVGYPGPGDGIGTQESLAKPTITQGTVSRFLVRQPDEAAAAGGGVGLYQHTASIGPGNSGGPLFNSIGEVVGINTEKSLIQTATVTEAGVTMVRVPLQDGMAWSQEVDELLPILRDQGIQFNVRTERLNGLLQWYYRDPQTAYAIGAILAVGLAVLTLLVLRGGPSSRPAKADPQHRSGDKASSAKPGVDGGKPTGRVPVVTGLSGPYAGKKFPVQSRIMFGRDPKVCGVIFTKEQDGISGQHCSLRFDATRGEFELTDENSSNGTFVNGRRLKPKTPQRLKSGDKFYLFKESCSFSVGFGTEPAAALDAGTTGNWQPH